jgi:TatD DNase family protein
MIDIGINLTDSAFAKDLDHCLADAKSAGVTAMIVTGTSAEGSEQAVALCDQHPDYLFATVGIHPHHANTWTSATERLLAQLATNPRVVAIGETGLDFNRNLSPASAQQAAFEAQLGLACELDLPVFLHERDAFERQHAILREFRDRLSGGVVHCFTGNQTALYAYLDLDLYIGITGWVCDERRGQELQRLVKQIPADRLLIETDAPYLLPRDLQPKPKSRRNEPRYLAHIASRIAELRAEQRDHLQASTLANTRRLFTRMADTCQR